MSDISGGPPIPKPLPPAALSTDRASKVSRDPNQTPRQATDDSGENRSKSEQRETLQARDPAVSISASAAQLRVGEELRQQVREVDAEGRPIIVTETATFALRPDAGLKAGDDVQLQVTETGKTVTADLLSQNGRTIDPPIRLALIVIAIHTSTLQNPDQQSLQPEKLEVAYRPIILPRATAVVTATNQTDASKVEALAKVLSRQATSFVTPPSKPAESAAPDPATSKPDPLIKSNSSDMATLLAAQQTSSTAAQANNPPPDGQKPQPQPQPSPNQQASRQTTAASFVSESGVNPLVVPGNSTRIIQPSVLTDVAAAPPTPSATTRVTSDVSSLSASGVPKTQGQGPVINAVSLTGVATQIQLLDLAISQVAPAEVAEVISVQPLPASVARNLSVSVQTLGAQALATLETNKGSFIVPQTAANTLVGEVVRISQPSQTANPQLDTATAVQTFAARLTSPGTQGGRQVQAQFIPQGQQTATASYSGQSHILTTVDAVHTTRAFLTGDGPKTDFRIDTPFGSLTVTMANSTRPAIGDTVAILPSNAGVPTDAAGVAATLAANASAAASAASASTATSSSWPSFEQAYALVQSGAPAAASALHARSAAGGPKLLNSMMFLMAAMKGGSPSSWLGKSASQALEAKGGNLLKLLQNDLGRLFNAATETGSEWRSLMIPFDTKGPDMPMLAALFNQPLGVDPDAAHGEDGVDDEEEKDQRFIVEVQFSVLGAIQLDGTVRKNSFDLTLWSTEPLPVALTNDTREIFANALAANGFSGSMRFKQGDTFPVDVAAVLKKQLAA
jgi:hypothetical protein